MRIIYLNLELALQHYEKVQIDVDFENGEMYYFEFSEDRKTWNFGAKPFPFTSFQYGNLLIADEELLSDFKNLPKNKMVLEADIAILGVSVNDKKYRRLANPAICMIADAAGLEQICQVCGIELRKVRKLVAIEEF